MIQVLVHLKKPWYQHHRKPDFVWLTFQHIAPKPSATATTTLEPSEEHLVMTGIGNESAEKITKKIKSRVLPKFLQQQQNEGADVLTHFGLHGKVNLNLVQTEMLWKHIKRQLFLSPLGKLSDG